MHVVWYRVVGRRTHMHVAWYRVMGRRTHMHVVWYRVVGKEDTYVRMWCCIGWCGGGHTCM